MKLAELWRYPVKSMAGEQLSEAQLDSLGVAGDRGLYVVNSRGRVMTARTRPQLLSLQGTLDSAGQVLVNGLPWRDAEVTRLVQAAAGEGTHLVEAEGDERFDVLPLLVATDGAIAVLGFDRRRFRPNLLIGDVPGITERSWEGKFLKIATAVVGLADLRQRCIMTTFDPDTQAQDTKVLHSVHDTFGGSLALNAYTARPGRVAVGDGVGLVEELGE
jgi:MOSC domain-containing protein